MMIEEQKVLWSKYPIPQHNALAAAKLVINTHFPIATLNGAALLPHKTVKMSIRIK